MTKVAFFADILSKDFDGASRTMYQIISRINHQKFDYQFYTGHDTMDKESRKELKIYETSNISVPFQKRYKMSIPQLSSRKLRNHLSSFNPDVIHIATPSLLGYWALKYASKNEIPVITIFHTYFSSYLKYYFKSAPWLANLLRKVTDRYQSWFYNKCSLIYVPSVSMKMELESIGVNSSKISIWERGIDHDLFNPDKENKSLLPDITNNSKKNILFVSRLVWEKNIRLVIELYKKMEQNGMPYNLIIAGSGHAESKMKSNMQRAYFLGSLSHEKLCSLYASSDVLLFPSISETFGNVVLEGLASGLPAIVAHKGGTKDMIIEGYNGYVCEENDVNSYYERIEQILTDDDLNKLLKKQARQSSKKYNWSDLSTRYFKDVLHLSTKQI